MGQGDRDDYKLHDLLAIFWRWRRLAAGAFLAILIPGVLVIFLMPPVYEATASILVNRVNAAPAYSVKTSPAVDPLSVVRNSHNAEEVKTAGEMIKTRATVDRVIDQLQLTKEKLNYIRDFRRYVQMAIDGVMDAAHWLYSEFKFTLHLAKRPTAEEKAFLDKEGLADSVADSISNPGSDRPNVSGKEPRRSLAECGRSRTRAQVGDRTGAFPWFAHRRSSAEP